MKSIYFFSSILLLKLFLIPSFGQSVKYTGTIDYSEEIIFTGSGAGSDDTYKWNSNASKTRTKKGSINVSFVKGFGSDQLGMVVYGLQSDVPVFRLSHNVISEGESERVQQTCVDYEKVKSKVVKPGASGKARSQERSELIGIPETGGSLQINAGYYNLNIVVNMKELINSSHSSESKDPCSSKDPPPINENSVHEIESPVVIIGDGKIENPSSISGQVTIEDISNSECSCPGLDLYHVHGDMDCSYSSKITASWKLVKQCETMGSVADELDKRDISQSVKERIKDMINKVNDPNTTDTYVFTGWYIISTVKTVEQAHRILDKKGEHMTDLRKLLDEYCSKSKNVEDLTDKILTTDKGIVDVVNRFNQQYISEHILTPGQVEIKDWIADQQRNPNSIYNSYAGK